MTTEQPDGNLDGVRRVARMVCAYGEALNGNLIDYSRSHDLTADFNHVLITAICANDDLLLMLVNPDAAHEATEAQRLSNEERRQKLQAGG